MTTEDNAGVPLLVPPEVTQQLERDECPTCQGVGSSWSDHVGNCPDCGGDGKRLAPRQVVALPETLTVECPSSIGMGTCDDGPICSHCDGTNQVPLPDGIYQLTTEREPTDERGPYSRPHRTLLGSPVRLTHRAWQDVVATRRPDKPSPYISGSGYLVLPHGVYDRLAARPHDGGVLLVEAP